jgi:hypothetical protein
MTHICSRNGWQWAAPTRMSLEPSHKILVLYLCVAAWVAWANQVSVCFDSRALLLLPAAEIQSIIIYSSRGQAPAGRLRSSMSRSNWLRWTNITQQLDAQCNDSWCDSTIPAFESEKKHFRKSGQMLTRLSPGPADLFDLFFFFLFFRVAFWIADLKVSTGWREEHSHALLPLLQLRNQL